MLRRCPDEAGLEARLWTWRAVQAQIFRSCNTEISRWTVLRYLNAWGFRPPNPMRRLRTQALAARTRAIKLNARQNGDAFFFLERTSVAAAGGSEPDAILWALGARADAAFMAAPESRLPERMSEFLDRVVDHAGGRSCVIVIGETLRRDIGMSKLTGGRNARIRIESLDVTGSGIFDRAALLPRTAGRG